MFLGRFHDPRVIDYEHRDHRQREDDDFSRSAEPYLEINCGKANPKEKCDCEIEEFSV